jgi:para-nitrobenzyl esterase
MKQQRLSDHLIAAWANFARTGNPNDTGDIPWPRWKYDGAAIFIQDDGWNHVQTNSEFATQHVCGLWQAILLYR